MVAAMLREGPDDETAAVCQYLSKDLGLPVNMAEGSCRWPPLYYMAKNGNAKGVRLLLDMGADPDCTDANDCADVNGQSPLFYAARAASIASIAALVDAGADLERRDKFGQTALFYAASEGACAECIRLLTPEGSDLAPRDFSGRTPLFVAAQRGHGAACRAIIECFGGGATIDVDRFGQSALFFAAAGGHTSCIKVLLEASAQVDAKDSAGQTPLFYAASQRHLGACNVLVQSGANPWTTDVKGVTPLARALAQNKERLGQMQAMVAFFKSLPGCPEAPAQRQLVKRTTKQTEAPKKQQAAKPAQAAQAASHAKGEKGSPIARRTRAGKRREAGLPEDAGVPQFDDDHEESAAEEEGDVAPPAKRCRQADVEQPAESEAERKAREEAERRQSEQMAQEDAKSRADEDAVKAPVAPPAAGPDATAPQQSCLFAWLDHHGLAGYADALAAEGYDDLEILADLGAEEVQQMLDAAGVAKSGHRLKFRHALRALTPVD